jgi:hypothetical protein
VKENALIYVILGMHKSGTTLVSQILHQSGINMVDEAISENASYDQGDFYERQSARQVNEAILKPKSLSLFDIVPLKTLEMSAAERSQMQAMIRDCAQKYSDWGFKDPRTCLTYPLWASELPEHKIIAIYRSPDELWQRQKSLSPLSGVAIRQALVRVEQTDARCAQDDPKRVFNFGLPQFNG